MMTVWDASKIVARREDLGLPAASAARAAKIARSQYWTYEHGTTPRPNTRRVICAALDLDPDTLQPIAKEPATVFVVSTAGYSIADGLCLCSTEKKAKEALSKLQDKNDEMNMGYRYTIRKLDIDRES